MPLFTKSSGPIDSTVMSRKSSQNDDRFTKFLAYNKERFEKSKRDEDSKQKIVKKETKKVESELIRKTRRQKFKRIFQAMAQGPVACAGIPAEVAITFKGVFDRLKQGKEKLTEMDFVNAMDDEFFVFC